MNYAFERTSYAYNIFSHPAQPPIETPPPEIPPPAPPEIPQPDPAPPTNVPPPTAQLFFEDALPSVTIASSLVTTNGHRLPCAQP
jgi:hypothetical protein